MAIPVGPQQHILRFGREVSILKMVAYNGNLDIKTLRVHHHSLGTTPAQPHSQTRVSRPQV